MVLFSALGLSLLSFAAAVGLNIRFRVSPVIPALISALIPYGTGIIVQMIDYSSRNISLWATFAPIGIIIVIAQFIVACFIFRKLSDVEGYVQHILWCIGGFLVIYYLVPFIVTQAVGVFNLF